MAEEEDVKTAETETAPESSTETETTEVAPETTPAEEPVDEAGVPLKNRIAERERKLRKAAETLDVVEATETEEEAPEPQEDPIKIVERITESKTRKLMEPLLTRQFLMDNPEALDLIDDIARVRKENPELRDVTKLDLAYKIARSEKQDELLRQAEERGRADVEQTKIKASQAAAQGTGKTTAPTTTMQEKIASATSLEELAALEKQLLGN